MYTYTVHIRTQHTYSTYRVQQYSVSNRIEPNGRVPNSAALYHMSLQNIKLVHLIHPRQYHSTFTGALGKRSTYYNYYYYFTVPKMADL